MTDRTIVQQAIVTGSYGTSSFDPETGDCWYDYYADITVEVGSMEWWQTEYDADENGWVEYKASQLFRDFDDMPCDFCRYRCIVWSDGVREHQPIAATR